MEVKSELKQVPNEPKTSKVRGLPSGINWVEDRTDSKLLFGPPLFDETSSSYNFRKFKRGFVYGKSIKDY